MRPGRSRAGRGYAGRRGGRGDGSPPGIRDTKARHPISSAGAALCRGLRAALCREFLDGAVGASRTSHPELSRSLPRSRHGRGRSTGDASNDRQESRALGLQASGKAEGTGASRPRVGRQGRREIGRALEALYEDVVREGVPAHIRDLLDDLDARTGSRPDPDRA